MAAFHLDRLGGRLQTFHLDRLGGRLQTDVALRRDDGAVSPAHASDVPAEPSSGDRARGVPVGRNPDAASGFADLESIPTDRAAA